LAGNKWTPKTSNTTETSIWNNTIREGNE